MNTNIIAIQSILIHPTLCTIITLLSTCVSKKLFHGIIKLLGIYKETEMLLSIEARLHLYKLKHGTSNEQSF